MPEYLYEYRFVSAKDAEQLTSLTRNLLAANPGWYLSWPVVSHNGELVAVFCHTTKIENTPEK